MDHLGDIAFRDDKNFKDAQDYYERLCTLQRSADNLVKVGKCYQKLNDLETAEKKFREATAIEPENASANFKLGHALARQNKKDESLK